MTHEHARRLCRSFAALLLAGIGLADPGRAVAKPPGLALVIGVGRSAGSAGGDACGPVARGVRDQLSQQGLAVQALLNPSVVAMRSAIDSFAAQTEAGPPGVALVYVCGAAIASEGRLFLVPSDTGSEGRVDPGRQAVVLQALLNALAGTGGTLYADLELAASAATGAALDEAGKRLPAGLHLALSLSGQGGAAPAGTRLLDPGFRADQGWDARAATLQAGYGAVEGAAQTFLLPPASGLPEPASPPPNAGGDASSEPGAAAPSATQPPPSADSDAPTPLEPAGSLPDPQQPAGVRNADASRKTGENAGRRGGSPDGGRIKRLQAALARNGYRGPVDGRLREPTVAAIRTFQRTLGNPETGVLTQAELVHLLNR